MMIVDLTAARAVEELCAFLRRYTLPRGRFEYRIDGYVFLPGESKP